MNKHFWLIIRQMTGIFFSIVFLKSSLLALHFYSSATINGSGNSADAGDALAIGNDGNIYATGFLYEGLGTGASNILLAKYNSSLILQSTITINGSGNFTDIGWGIAIDASDNIWVTGYVTGTSQDIWIGKFSSSLILQSSITVNGPANSSDKGNDIAVDYSGNVLVTGMVTQTGTSNDIWVAKYDPYLVLLASTSIKSPYIDEGMGIKSDRNGNIWVIGYIATVPGSPPKNKDIWIGKFTSSLVLQSSITINGSANGIDAGNDIAISDDGYVYATGAITETVGGSNIWIAKYDPSFNPQTSITIDGSGNGYDTGQDISISGETIYVAARTYSGSSAGGNNGWVGHFNSSLILQSSATIRDNNNGDDVAQCVQPDNKGSVYVTGQMFIIGRSYDFYITKHNVIDNLDVSGSFHGIATGHTAITWNWEDIQSENGYAILNPAGDIVSGNLNPNTTFWTESNLSPNTEYTRQVVAFAGIVSSSSAFAGAYTFAAEPEPAVFNNISTTSLQANWTANGNPSSTLYTVIISTAVSPGTNNFIGNKSSTTINTFAIFTGLTAGTTYYVEAKATNSEGIDTTYISLGTVKTLADKKDDDEDGEKHDKKRELITEKHETETIEPDKDKMVVFRLTIGEVRLEIPQRAFQETITVKVEVPAAFPKPVSSGGDLKSTGVGVEIILDKPVQPARDVTISVTYSDEDVKGLDENKLILARHDTDTGSWMPLISSVDMDANRVTGKTKHFSLFQVMQQIPSSSVSSAIVYPNPYRPAQGDPLPTFAGLPSNARIRIYTLNGELVRTLYADVTGMINWNCKNESGAEAASGVYFVLAEGEGGRKTFKMAIQR